MAKPGRPRKNPVKVTDKKKLRTYRTRTEATDDESENIKTPVASLRGRRMETHIEEEFFNACKQNLHLMGQVFVPGAIIPKEYVTDFYLNGGHIASRNKLVTRKLE